MKKFRGISLVAASAAVALGLSGCALPYQSEVIEGTQITVAWNDLISELNSSSVTGNNTANAVVLYMTSSGFNYYNSDPALVKNDKFGTYRKVSDEPLTIEYTINEGVKWSDGVQIDGADMLLAWASIFGYGKSGEDYLFQHANPREDLSSKIPTVNGRTITFEYDKAYVDWELQFGVGVAAHGTVQMAYPDLSAEEAKAKLIEAIQNGDTEWLKPVADKWNTGYQVTGTPDALQALSSGPYIIEELVADQYVTLVSNPVYTWGPSPKYERITVREIADSTAAVQAVDNGEVQIASGQPTADVLSLVQGLTNGKFQTGDEATYEHIDLSFNNGGPFDPATYGGDADKARKVRQAFLLTIPRQQIVDNLIKPLNPNATVRNSFLTIPGSEAYAKIEPNNGSSEYASVDIERAKALLAEAGVTTPIEVGFWYPEGNVRRGQEFELIAASAALAGFNLVDESEPDWAFLSAEVNPHDAVIFAWQSTSLAITGSDQIFGTGKPSNFNGFSSPEIDALLSELDTALDPARQDEIRLEVEKILWAEAYGTTIFQFPGLTWWDAGVEGVDSSPLSPSLFWNYWDWKPIAG